MGRGISSIAHLSAAGGRTRPELRGRGGVALLTQTIFSDTACGRSTRRKTSPGIGVSRTTCSTSPAASFSSSSDYSGVEKYFHVLTHEWGYTVQPGKWDTAACPTAATR